MSHDLTSNADKTGLACLIGGPVTRTVVDFGELSVSVRNGKRVTIFYWLCVCENVLTDTFKMSGRGHVCSRWAGGCGGLKWLRRT